MLVNGQGKDRMRDRGGLRRTATWRTLFLSSGEEGLADLLARATRRAKAGQHVRLLDLPADAGAGFGLFDTVHECADGDAIARLVRKLALANHGTAGPAFLDWLAPMVAARQVEFIDSLKDRVRGFARSLMPNNAESQVARAAGRFALVTAAGELATEAGVTGWPAGEVQRAARILFDAWLAARGGVGNLETHQLVQAVRKLLVAHGPTRFETLRSADDGDDGGQTEPPAPDTHTINRAGWKWQEIDNNGARHWIHGFAPDVFAAEIAQPLGMDPREARAKLDRASVLLAADRGGRRRRTTRKRIPGHGVVELVAILPAIFASADDPGMAILGSADGAE